MNDPRLPTHIDIFRNAITLSIFGVYHTYHQTDHSSFLFLSQWSLQLDDLVEGELELRYLSYGNEYIYTSI